MIALRIRPLACFLFTVVGAAASIVPGDDLAKWRVGAPPPKPWQHTANRDGITVKVVSLEGKKWLEFRDASIEAPAGIRCEIPAQRAARLTLRVRMADDHAETNAIGFYLGTGNVSTEVERVVDVKTGLRGVLRLGSANERVPTSLTLAPGITEHLFIEFRPAADGIHLRLGRIAAAGEDQLLKEVTLAKPATPVDRLRITSDGKTQGAHFFITDLKLTPLKSP